MVHIYSVILLSHLKEWDIALCNNMDGPRGIMLSEISQRKINTQCVITYMWNLKNKADD